MEEEFNPTTAKTADIGKLLLCPRELFYVYLRQVYLVIRMLYMLSLESTVHFFIDAHFQEWH